ncbi:MAG: transcription elongation factor GreA [Patescibacteria group bacterium]
MPDPDSEYFSEVGLEKLKKELDERKTKVRQEIAQRLEYAKSLGDLSENSEYQEAKEFQMLNESTIAELEDTLRRSVLVHKSIAGDTVEIGSYVTVEDVKNRIKMSFNIVGANEVAPLENKISHESPLGHAIFGHKKGDIVKAQTPKGQVEYKIIDIS